MAKIRHISYRAEDVDAMAKFFIDAMGLTIVQKRDDGAVDLTDGSINIAILPSAANRSRSSGLDHIGFSAEDDQEQIRRVEAAGGVSEPRGHRMKRSSKVRKESSSMSAAGRAQRLRIKSRVFSSSQKNNVV
jgi:catechol 2,3-dioxygenase-like lactoylglutathione lyase family enzyme